MKDIVVMLLVYSAGDLLLQKVQKKIKPIQKHEDKRNDNNYTNRYDKEDIDDRREFCLQLVEISEEGKSSRVCVGHTAK